MTAGGRPPDRRQPRHSCLGRDARLVSTPSVDMTTDASAPAVQEPVTASSKYSKPCDICQTPKDVLIRCQIDETAKWHFVCTGKCWREVSGGKVDGDETHPKYRYGGMWKNSEHSLDDVA